MYEDMTTMTTRRFVSGNRVPTCPGWFYGVRVLRDDDCIFDVYHKDGVQRIEGITASRYRTTTLARSMGDTRKGWQYAAQLAIRNRGGRYGR